MDWKTFYVNIVDSIAWPILIFIFILIFRKPFKTLLDRLAKLDYRGVSFSFSDKVAALSDMTTEKELSQTKEQERTEKTILPEDIIQESPRKALFLAWQLLENSIIQKFSELQITVSESKRHYIPGLMQDLRRFTTIEHDSYKIFNYLRALKDEASRNPDLFISTNDASGFIDYVKILINRISLATLPSSNDDSTKT